MAPSQLPLRGEPGETDAPAKVARGRAQNPAMADRRGRIIEFARRRFAEYGFETTTVRQIADDVNILSGSLYHHFATKEDMLHEMVRGAVERLRDRATAIAALDADAELRLVTLILADLEEFTAAPEVHAILYDERKFFRRSPDFAYVLGAKKATYHAWQAILDDGIAAGRFAGGRDPYLTISTILRMLNTGAAWYRTEEGSILDGIGAHPLDQLTDFYLDFILRAIRVPERAGEPIPRAEAEALGRTLPTG